MTARSSSEVAAERDAFVNTLLDASRGVFLALTGYVGDRLGYYRILAEDGPLASPELAKRAGTHERYAREWLEQQTVSGVLRCVDPGADATARRYELPAGHAEVLVDVDSLDYLAPLLQLLGGTAPAVASVVAAHRSGEGVPYAAFGADLREGQARFNRVMFTRLLPDEWLPAMPDVHARLLADPPARVADVGCGAAWSSIGIARAYPSVRVDGIDLDPPSVELARKNVEEAGLSDRVRVEARDAADPQLRGRYDLVTAFECIHDLARPVEVLRAMRGLLAGGGVALVVDERVGDVFTPEGEGFEWMMYGWSVLSCLPVGMADRPSAMTGTVMRRPTLERYAKEAGFSRVEVAPVENPFLRVYRLVV